MEGNYLLLAGDARLRTLTRLLQRDGCSAEHLHTELPPDALRQHIAQHRTVILPTPVSKDGVTLFSANDAKLPMQTVLDALEREQTVFGGGFSAEQTDVLTQKGVRVMDFLKNESFTVFNAYLTAQGALRLLLENTGNYLPGCRVLITGYGRVAKACAELLHALGCEVYIAARDPAQRTQARLRGYRVLEIASLESSVFLFDFILNTVPSPLFSKEMLQVCKTGAIYLELASAPFGAERKDFEGSGMHYIFGGSLPGRFCAAGAAAAMLEQIKAT